MKRTMLSPFAPPAVAAIAALGLASPAAAATAAERSPDLRAADATIKVNNARISQEARSDSSDQTDGTVTVNVTYACAKATDLAVVVGQPPRDDAGSTERLAAGRIAPTCDGRTRTIDVRTEVQSGSSSSWQAGAPATLGAVMFKALDTKFQVVARDSRTLSLS
ncbi:hypothetical protein ACFVH6_06920 [Spirillospora sp. NPDC127200]